MACSNTMTSFLLNNLHKKCKRRTRLTFKRYETIARVYIQSNDETNISDKNHYVFAAPLSTIYLTCEFYNLRNITVGTIGLTAASKYNKYVT